MTTSFMNVLPERFKSWSEMYRHCVELGLDVSSGGAESYRVLRFEFMSLPPLGPEVLSPGPEKYEQSMGKTIRYEVGTNFLKARVFDEIIGSIPNADTFISIRRGFGFISSEHVAILDGILNVCSSLKG